MNFNFARSTCTSLRATAFGLVALSAIGGCASAPKEDPFLERRHIFKDVDPLMGWTVPKKIPPVVGDFDVIYNGDEASNGNDNCAYADGPDRSIVVCEKGAPQVSRRGALRGPTHAM